MSGKAKKKELVFVIEWRVDADDALDGLDGVREALTANGSCKVVDVRIEEAEAGR